MPDKKEPIQHNVPVRDSNNGFNKERPLDESYNPDKSFDRDPSNGEHGTGNNKNGR